MKEAKRSLLATLGVIAVIGTIVAGSLVRNVMEVGVGLSVGEPITMDVIVLRDDVPYGAEVNGGAINESTFFYQLSLLLEREFVDPVEHNEDLAVGAVRAMVNSLADSYSLFYNEEQMEALNARRAGIFEGIGVEVRLKYNDAELSKLQNYLLSRSGSPHQDPVDPPVPLDQRFPGAPGGGADSDVNFDPALLIPIVLVSTVVDDGPADKAGLKVGDRVTQINGKWAISSLEVLELRGYKDQFDADELTADELQAISEVYKNRGDNAISPSRAIDLLMLGASSEVVIEWDDADKEHHRATVQKSRFNLPAVAQDDDVVRVRFFKGAIDELRKIDWPDGPVTLDLRHSTLGDYSSMSECLGYFGGRGVYGEIRRTQAGSHRLLRTKGEPFGREIRLIVDDSTWGAAAVFASALVSAGKAVIAEGELTADLPWVDLYHLPGGTGYTLKTGTFVPATEGAE